MPCDDLRGFLEVLDREGQLLPITDEVLPEPDVDAAANAAARMGGSAPALFFSNVKGSPTPDLGRARRMRPDLTVVPLVDVDPGQVAGADDKGRRAAGRGRMGQAGLKPD
ncbi:hypothetical protein [Kutzneria sp. NPDC051319]|uniref:hypothetical protein n=1 Tax=Kutzneria sp. NPDC051319 TaxID=3155047 RepID=UPI00341758C5